MTNAPAASRPRRRRLVDEVRDLIARDYIFSGVIETGALLPSEKELSDRYGVSRVTLRSSMQSLEQAGLIVSHRGVGSILRPGSAMLLQGLDRLSSLETFAREAGQEVTTENLQFDRRPADEAASAKLNVSAGHPILVVTRMKSIGDDRAAWLVDRVPEGVISFDTIEREFSGSLLDVLLDHTEIGLEYGDTELRPINLSTEMAARLDVPRGRAALHVDAQLCRADASVVAWAEAWVLPDHFRFLVRRRRHFG